jgi:hypothetical protein
VPLGNSIASLTCPFGLRGWRGDGLAGQVLLKIVCLLMRWLFSLAALVVRGDEEKNAELLVLRHENAVLRRHAGRIRYEPGNRAWFAALTRFIPRRRRTEVFPVTPATLRPESWLSISCTWILSR